MKFIMIIGLDAGGTHTDIVLLDRRGIVKTIKISTNADDMFGTILYGLKEITKDIEKGKINRLVLSTTLATNAIIQKKTEKTGLIVFSGPGVNPEDLKLCEDFYPAGGSIDHRGNLIENLDEKEIEAIGEKLQKNGIKYLGIVSKFSTRNPSLELKAEEILAQRFDKIFLGHNISGKLNFPRRIATTYLNAAIYKLHNSFFNSVKKSLEAEGLNIPIYILKADGGTMNLESSLEKPAETILSGPASSAMGSIVYAKKDSETVSIDVGGTTTDISIFINGSPCLEPVGIETENYKTLIRSLKTKSIGIGGDSFVRVENGEIKIGPERKDSAMAFGGKYPTVIDAAVVLGKIENADKKMAESGIRQIADNLGLEIKETAEAIFNLATKMILDAVQKMVDEVNSKPFYTIEELLEEQKIEPKKILVLGTPAKIFAEKINETSDFKAEAIPNYSVANAIGAALSKTTTEVEVLADTEKGRISATGGIFQEIGRRFSFKDALEFTTNLLKDNALKMGAKPENFEMEIIESSEFNIIRNFYNKGKNIRVKAQVKPGFIKRYSEEQFSLKTVS